MKKGRLSQSVEIIGIGLPCDKCGKEMQRRAHKYLTEKQKSSPYYFSEWDVCVSGCNFMKHYDKYKVYNKNDMSTYMQLKEEEGNLISFIRRF